MSTLAPTHPAHARAVPIYTTVLGWLFVAACAIEAIYQPVFDKANSQVSGDVGYLVAAVLVAAGLLTYRSTSPRLSVALVTLGALVGGVMLVWTLVMPIIAMALVVLFVMNARRSSPASARPAG